MAADDSTINGSGAVSLAAQFTLRLGGVSGNLIADPVANNAGSIQLATPASLTLGNSTTLNDTSGGVFDLQADASILGDGSRNAININSGATFEKSAGVGTSTVQNSLTLVNAGTIQGASGTLDLAGGGTNSGAFNSSASSATIKLGGTWALNSGTAFTGTGITNAYGTLNLNANASASTYFQLASGAVLQGGSTFTSNNKMDWNAGASVKTPLVNSSGAALNIFTSGNNPVLSGALVTNNGTATLSGGGTFSFLNSAHFKNVGTFTIAADRSPVPMG